MTKPKKEKLFWLKFNPTEWIGYCDGLSDGEFGLFHRVIARLWETPGNRLPLPDLKRKLRIRDGDERDQCLTTLLSYVLELDEEGMVRLPRLEEAYAEATGRSEAGKRGAETRWEKAKTAEVQDSSELNF